VTFKGPNQFWIRHDRQKSRMSIHEIKDTCLKVEGLMEKLERFLAKRRHDIFEDISDIPYYVVSVTPLFVDSKAIDIQDKALHNFLENPAPFDESGRFSFGSGFTRFTLHGLRTQYYSYPMSALLFRNGHLEFWLEANKLSQYSDIEKPQAINRFSSQYLIANSFAFISLSRRVFTHIGLTDPVIVSVSFYNIKGCGLQMYGSIMSAPIQEHQRWNKDHLEIPSLQFFSLSPVKETAKECLDRIFQAFGYDAAPNLPNDLLNT
jgi:hypothetical protein